MYENEEDITKGVRHFIRTVQTDRLVKRRRLVEGIGINGELSKEEFISNSGLEIDFRSVTVAVEGKPVILTPLEFNLLGCLARGRGMVMSNKYLLQQVWDIRDDENNVHNLRVFVSRMRTKLGESGQKPRYIQNRRGFGYMMPKFEESLAEE